MRIFYDYSVVLGLRSNFFYYQRSQIDSSVKHRDMNDQPENASKYVDRCFCDDKLAILLFCSSLSELEQDKYGYKQLN